MSAPVNGMLRGGVAPVLRRVAREIPVVPAVVPVVRAAIGQGGPKLLPYDAWAREVGLPPEGFCNPKNRACYDMYRRGVTNRFNIEQNPGYPSSSGLL